MLVVAGIAVTTLFDIFLVQAHLNVVVIRHFLEVKPLQCASVSHIVNKRFSVSLLVRQFVNQVCSDCVNVSFCWT